MADRLSVLLQRFELRARVFHRGLLCGTAGFDAAAGVGHLHLLRCGKLTVTDAAGQRSQVSEPAVLFLPRPTVHRLEADDAELVCASIDFGAGDDNPLLRGLPEWLCSPLAELPGLALTQQLLFDEAAAGRCGHGAVVDRLSEVLVIQLLRHAIEHGWHLRFIEQMPLDAQGSWERSEMVTAAEIHDLLESEFTLEPVPGRGSAPAEEFAVDGGPATVGIIASVSKPFCSACDRLRLTADGQIRNCLFAREETDVRATLRDPALTEAERRSRIAGLFAASTLAKLPGHGINDPSFIQPDRPMSAIGG